MVAFEGARKMIDRLRKDRSARALSGCAVVVSVLLVFSPSLGVDRAFALPVLLGLSTVFLAQWLGRAERNSLLALRTPSTLESGLAWNEVHSLARWLFSLLGIILLANAWPGNQWIWIAVFGVGINRLILGVYAVAMRRREPSPSCSIQRGG